MRKPAIFLVLLSFLSPIQSFANQIFKTRSLESSLHSCNKKLTHGKIYTHSQDLYILEHGIFLNLGGQLLAVNSVGFDNRGIYCKWDSHEDMLWECLKCGTLNEMKYYRCTYCGWDRRN